MGGGFTLKPEHTFSEKVKDKVIAAKTMLVGPTDDFGDRARQEERDLKALHDRANEKRKEDSLAFCNHHHCYEYSPCAKHGISSSAGRQDLPYSSVGDRHDLHSSTTSTYTSTTSTYTDHKPLKDTEGTGFTAKVKEAIHHATEKITGKSHTNEYK
jgi:hypothetical protein